MKRVYPKRATTYDDQIKTLKQRGAVVEDENKAKEYLSDIGYYRLGFYLYPFEITYPELGSRRYHTLQPNTRIEDAVALYYFDMDLRNILNRYLSRIEVAIRTTIIYELSNKYSTNPTWFVDPTIVSAQFISAFPAKAYNSIKTKGPIKRHHQRYLCQYAPAWKTMEYMTLGNLEILYDNLLLDSDKKLISIRFGEPATATFKSYMMAVREVRNACAHGNVLWDLTLCNGILSGIACPTFPPHTQQTFHGALRVIDYLLRQISVNRANDMWTEIHTATKLLYSKSPSIKNLIESKTGIILPNKVSRIKGIANLLKKIIEKIAD